MPYCPECSASVPEGAAQCPTCGSTLVTTPSTADQIKPEAPALDIEQLRAELAASLSPRYEVLKLLGSGGMGAVFLAREPTLRRLVAVKVLAPFLAAEPRARSRFEREARAAAALSHPNVVRVYAVGETATTRVPYIIMQYVEGATLGQWMAGRKRVPERDARRIIGEVAAALAAAHARELVHRDVKPSNVLIETESGRAFVADFGVSAALSPVDQTTKLTMTGTVVGTPAYMSPEQAAADQVGPKSDVYSLGLLAYELLTGALPYSATSAMGWAAAHLRDPATPVGIRRPDLSPEVARLVDRCLAKRPEERPEAEDVSRAMMPSPEGEVPWPPPGLAPLHRKGRLVARLSLLTALGGLVTMFALAFTPRILQVHPHWLNRFSAGMAFTGPTRVVIERDPAITSQFVWQSTLILGFAALAVSLAGLLSVLTRIAVFALARRRRGWGWPTLLDVAVDYDGRTGLLLAAAREFASLDQASLRAVLRSRRVQTIAEALVGPWVVLVAAVWIVALIAGWSSNATIASPIPKGVWWAAALPGLVGLMVSADWRVRERRLLRPVLQRPQFDESEADVQAWYASTPGMAAPPAPRRLPGRLALLASQTVAAAVGLALLASLAVAGVAALIAASATSRLGPAALQLNSVLVRVNRENPFGTFRRLAAPYLPVDGASDDSAISRGLRILLRHAATPPLALPDYDPRPGTPRPPSPAAPVPQRQRSGLVIIPTPPGRPGPDGRRGALSDPNAEVIRRAVLRQIPPDTVRLWRAWGSHPRTALFRQLARASRWDVLAAFADRPISAYPSLWALPDPSVSQLADAALANVFGAAAEAAAGNLALARRRLGENAAVSLLLVEAPTRAFNTFARSMAGSYAFLPLGELEQLEGNARQAAELRAAVGRMALLEELLIPWGGAGLAADPSTLEADPSTPLTLAWILRDQRLPVGWRIALMNDVRTGACTNPREILLGESQERRAVLIDAAAHMSDVPHATDLAQLVIEGWYRLATSGPTGSREDVRVNGPLPRLLWRIALCLNVS